MKNKRKLVPWIAILFIGGAVLCGLAGLVSGLTAANRVEDLTPVTARELADGQPGDRVLIEGTISEENAPQFREYVAYIRESRDVESSDGTPEPGSWSESARLTPPLLVELEGTLVSVPNDDYDLDVAYAVEEETLAPYASVRYRGLAAGDPVLVVGTVAGGGERVEVEADLVADGTQESYVSRQRNGGVLLCVGSALVAALGGVILLWDRIAALVGRRR